MRTFILWLVIGDLVLSGLIVFWRGAAGSRRTYGPTDAIGAVIETGLIAWAIYWLATT